MLHRDRTCPACPVQDRRQVLAAARCPVWENQPFHHQACLPFPPLLLSPRVSPPWKDVGFINSRKKHRQPKGGQEHGRHSRLG